MCRASGLGGTHSNERWRCNKSDSGSSGGGESNNSCKLNNNPDIQSPYNGNTTERKKATSAPTPIHVMPRQSGPFFLELLVFCKSSCASV